MSANEPAVRQSENKPRILLTHTVKKKKRDLIHWTMYMYTTATTTTTTGSAATENQAFLQLCPVLTPKQDYVNYQLDFPDFPAFCENQANYFSGKMLTDEAETFCVTGKGRRQ